MFKLVRRNLDNKINPYNLINSIITKKRNRIKKTLKKNNLKHGKLNYQVRNLEWMINLEKYIANKSIDYTSPEIVKIGDVYLDTNLERFYSKDYIKKINNNIIFKGGALIDSHFTGRKETLLDLSLKNPSPIKKMRYMTIHI